MKKLLNNDNNLLIEELKWSLEVLWTQDYKDLLLLMKKA